MEYKWYDIRKKIVNACKKVFTEQGMAISTADIEEATDLFDRIVSYRLDYQKVGNLQQDMQHTLQQVFVDNVGASADLRNAQNLIEPFLKKILVMSGIKTQADIARERPMLKYLLQYTNASSTFSAIGDVIRPSTVGQYDKDSTGAFIFCKIYLGRNDVHDSPELDPGEVYEELRYTMAAYILVTHHLKDAVLARHPNVAVTVRMDLSEINETGYVYDFINYGNTSNKIKNRIVESFILNWVYKKSEPVSIDALVKEVIAFSRQSLSESSIKSIIGRLIPDKLQYENQSKKLVKLTEAEQARIVTALDGYRVLVERLMRDIESLLDEYGLKEKLQGVYLRLKKFFEDNCLAIIQIMNDQDGELCGERSEEYIEDFKRFLKNIGCPDDKKDELFKGLLQTCALNDVLVKIALGKNFTNISNPESFASGLKQREKKVYLDTQLLLYALCDYDNFIPFNGSPSFVIVKSLLNLAKQNPNIKLATINQYVNEAAYHLKRAVQLISFDDIYYDSRIKLSDNVFYSYYYYLKDNDLLDEGIETLADFLDDMFDVTYQDMLQGNFESRNYNYIAEILENECGIVVEDPPFFSDTDVDNSEKVFTTALLAKRDSRPAIAAHKDAIMGLYLFNNEHRAISEPFFLSWDRTFYTYRKDYIKAFLRNGTSWHLFSPAKFVNHLNLLDMKIDVDVLTEDLISIIEDDDTAQNTKHVLDSIRKLFDRSNVTSRKKRKEYTEIIFNETEFPDDTTIPDEKQLKLTSDFALAFDKVLTLMQTGDHKLTQFTEIVGDEKRFKEIVASMRKRLKTESVDQCAAGTFDDLVKEINEAAQEQG